MRKEIIDQERVRWWIEKVSAQATIVRVQLIFPGPQFHLQGVVEPTVRERDTAVIS